MQVPAQTKTEDSIPLNLFRITIQKGKLPQSDRASAFTSQKLARNGARLALETRPFARVTVLNYRSHWVKTV